MYLLLFSIIIVGCASPSSGDYLPETDLGAKEIMTKPAEQRETESEPSVTTYGAGMYKVGDDIPAGEYLIEANTSTLPAYIEVSSDSSGTIDSIITNDNFYNRICITVSDGQYLQFSDGIATPATEAKPYQASNRLYPAGMYLVGKDIEAGEYKISVEDGSITGFGYYEVSSNSLGILDSIITNNNIQNDTYQTLADGQYITLSGTYIQH